MSELGSSPPETEPIVQNTSDALKARILLKDQRFLHEDVFIHENTDEYTQVETFQKRNYSPFEQLSRKRRQEYWNKKVANGEVANNYEEQYEKWEQKVINSLTTQKKKVAKLEPLFKQIFSNTLPTTYGKDQVSAIYDHYFEPLDPDNPDKLTGLKLFIKESLDSCKDADGKINNDKYEEMKEAIVWFSGAFGETNESAKANLTKTLLEAEMMDSDKVSEDHNKNNMTDVDLSLLHEITEVAGERFLPKVFAFDTEEVIKEITDRLSDVEQDRILIMTGTGTGKTTRTPGIIVKRLMKERTKRNRSKVFVTQPTKMNAEATADGIRKTMGYKDLGKEIGFHHGDKQQRNEYTNEDDDVEQVRVMTEGVATNIFRELFNKGVGELNKMVGEEGVLYIMEDEVHKLGGDQVFNAYIVTELLKKPEFKGRIKAIFATATADKVLYERKLGIPAATDTKPGGTFEKEVAAYKVEEFFNQAKSQKTHEQILDLNPQQMRETISYDVVTQLGRISKLQNTQNIAAFFPGIEEMKAVEERIKQIKALPNVDPFFKNLEIRYIHGGSTEDERKAVSELKSEGDKRYLFLCTNSAETGVTFQTLSDVIATGIIREMQFNSQFGMEELIPRKATKSEFKQTKGRVGRTEEGRAHYLYVKNANDLKLDQQTSYENYPMDETKRTDLTEFLLKVKLFKRTEKIDDLLATQPFLTDLDPKQVEHAKTILGPNRLGALDASENITRQGELMQGIQVDYHRARSLAEAMVIEGGTQKRELYEAVAIISAILELKDKEKLFKNLIPGTNDINNERIVQNRVNIMNEVNKITDNSDIKHTDFLRYLLLWRKYQTAVGVHSLATEDGKRDRKIAHEDFCRDFGLDSKAVNKINDLLVNKLLNKRQLRGSWQRDIIPLRQNQIAQCIEVGHKDRQLEKVPNQKNLYILKHKPIESDATWESPIVEIKKDNLIISDMGTSIQDTDTLITAATLRINRYATVSTRSELTATPPDNVVYAATASGFQAVPMAVAA